MRQYARSNLLEYPRAGAVRRGFALPLVVLLSLVATVLIAVMLDRQGAQRLTVSRAADEYREAHFARGMSEVVDAWMINQGTKSFRDLLGSDGKAFDLELAKGPSRAVYFRDAQGLLLKDTSGLGPDDAADLKGAMQHLVEAVGPQDMGQFTRPFGPPAVSALSAPVEVLAAMSRQIAGAQKADDLLRALLELREKTRPTAQDLVQAAVSSELDDVQRKVLTRLIIIDSAFYRMTMDARDPDATSSSLPTARYEAYALPRGVGTGTNRRNISAGSVQRRSQIVGWERVEIR